MTHRRWRWSWLISILSMLMLLMVACGGSQPEPVPEPEPTEAPAEPTEAPEPTEEPAPEPTEEPAPEPTEEPAPEPTEEPAPEPTEEPAPEPTEEPEAEPEEAAADEVTLRWRTRPDNQAEIDVYQGISDVLDDELANIGLTYEPGGSETSSYQDVLKTELAAGTAPDVFWIPGTDIADFATRGLIMDMREMADADSNHSDEDFYPGPMFHLTYNPETAQTGETLWGLPRDVSTFVIYLNMDLIEEAGAPDPRELAKNGEWDWDSFLEVASAVNGLGDDVRGYGQSAWWGPYGYWINAAGGNFFNEDRSACGLDTPEALAGLEFERQIYQEFDVAVPYGEDSEPPFLAGNVGMFQNGRWATPGVRSSADFNWDAVKLPDGPAGPSNWLFWGAYVVNGNTEHPEEAYELVRSLTRADIQGQISELGANIPSRVSDEAIDAFLTFSPPDNNQAYIEGLSENPQTEGPLWAGSWPEYDAVMGPAVSAVLNGEQTIEDFASTICDEANLVFTGEGEPTSESEESSQSEASGEEVALRWRTRPDNQAEIDVYQGISDVLDDELANIGLTYEPGGSETSSYQDVLKTELAAGTAPDVFWIPGTDIADFATRGLIMDMREMADADSNHSDEDFYPGPMFHLTYNPETAQTGETLWGLPRDVSTFVLYLNMDLIEEAGAPDPRELAKNGEWDWDSFLEVASAVNGLGDDVRGYGQSAWWGPYGYWINAAGGNFFNEDRSACGLDTPEALAGLEFERQIYQEFDVAVPYGEDSEPPFLAGNVGMFQNGRWATPGVRSSADFNWDAVKLPDGPAGPSNWLFWGAYVVNGNTEHPEEAYELVRSLTRADIQGQISELGANIPSRVSDEAIDAFLTFSPPDNNQAYIEGLSENPQTEGPLWAGSWPEYDAIMGPAVSAVLNGEQSIEDFASTICDEANLVFTGEGEPTSESEESSESEASGEEVALRWRTRPDNQAEIDVYQGISDVLDDELANIGLTYEPGGSETSSYQDVLKTELAAGTAPDVFWIPGTDIADFATRGLIMDMREMADADSNHSDEDFYPGPMFHLTYNPETAQTGETLWGLPRDVSTFVIYLNMDLIEEAGAPDPRELAANGEWDWDSFLEVASAVNGLGDDVRGYGQSAWWGPYGYWINAAGGNFFNEDRSACGLDTPEALAGLEFERQIYQEFDVAVPYGEDSEPPFLAGNVGMFQNGRWATPGVRSSADFNWDAVKLPDGPAGPSNWLFWGAYVVNGNTEHPEEAYELVRSLTRADIQGQISELGANIPSRVSDEAIDAFLTFSPPDNNQAYIEGLSENPQTEGPLWAGSWPEYDAIMGPAVSAVLNGEQTIEDFASTICDEANLVFTGEGEPTSESEESSQSEASGEEVALRWRTRPDNQAEIDVYQGISDVLDEELANIGLTYEPGGSETSSYQDVLKTELAAGTAPDVFWIPGTDIADFATRGLIMDMREMADADSNHSDEDFYPGPMFHLTYNPETAQTGETLWGLPRDVSTFVLYLNMDLIEEAGAPDPRELAKNGEWDWDSFLEVASAVNGLGDDVRGYGQSAWWGPYGYWINAAGGNFFNEDRSACGLDTPEALAGLEFERQIYQEFDVAVPYGEDSEPPFLAGNVGMFQNGRWATPGVRSSADFNWDAVKLPDGPAGPSNWLFWGAYVVNGNTEHPEEAYELVRSLTRADIQGQISELGANIPSRVSDEAIDAFLTFSPPDNNQAYISGLSENPQTEGPLWAGSWPEYDAVMGPAVSAVLNGEQSIDDFASTICDEANLVFTGEGEPTSESEESSQSEASGEEVALRWRTRPDNQAEIDVYQGISDVLDEELSNIGLTYEPGGSETSSYQDVLKTELAAGTAPDVFWIPGTDIADFATRGLIMDMREMADADGNHSDDDFYPGPMFHLTYNPETGQTAETLWGLPRDVSTFVLYLNMDLIEEAGAPDPRELAKNGEWDWDSFLEVASAVNGLGDDVRGYGQSAWWGPYGYWINAAGGNFFNEDRSACGLDTPEALAGLEFERQIYQEFDVAVPYGEDSEPPFLAGNVGMFQNGRWATPGVRSSADFNWDAVKLPDGPAGPSNWLFWGAYVVNANTENPEAAYELVRSLTRADIQGQISELGANIPSRVSDEAIDAFLTFSPPDNNQAYIEGLSENPQTEGPLWAGSWPEYDAVMGPAVSAVLNGEQSIDDFASTICDEANLAFGQ